MLTSTLPYFLRLHALDKLSVLGMRDKRHQTWKCSLISCRVPCCIPIIWFISTVSGVCPCFDLRQRVFESFSLCMRCVNVKHSFRLRQHPNKLGPGPPAGRGGFRQNKWAGRRLPAKLHPSTNLLSMSLSNSHQWIQRRRPHQTFHPKPLHTFIMQVTQIHQTPGVGPIETIIIYPRGSRPLPGRKIFMCKMATDWMNLKWHFKAKLATKHLKNIWKTF